METCPLPAPAAVPSPRAWSWRGRVAAAGLSAALFGACFPPLDWSPLGFAALVPLFLALEGVRPLPAAGLAWLAGGLGALACGSWLGIAFVDIYGFSLPGAGAALLASAAYIGAFVAVVGLIHGVLRDVPHRVAWRTALWVGAEMVRAKAGLSWFQAGHTQTWLPLMQAADLGGVPAVSLVVVAVNAGLAEAWCTRRVRPLAVPALLLLVNLAYGVTRLATFPPPGPAHTVAMVQPDIPQVEKWDLARFGEHMRLLHRLTSQAVAQPVDLVVWPETALTVDVMQARQTLAPITALLGEGGPPLLLGAPRVEHAGDPPVIFNSAVLVRPDGLRDGVYDKQWLLPWGEAPPAWLRVWPGLHAQVERRLGTLRFSAGVGPQLLHLGSVPFGAVICYEAGYPELVGAEVDAGARFVVNLTNDAWFRDSPGAAAHLAMVRWRALEHRVPVLRAANTGISAVVDATGKITAQLGLGTPGVLRAAFTPGPGGAVYTRTGDALAATGCASILALALWSLLSRRTLRGSAP